MDKWPGWCLWALILCCASPLLAQTPAPTPQLPTPTFRDGKKFFVRDGKVVPLFWAFGLSEPSQLDEYKNSGFNTLIIPLTWPNTPDNALGPSDLKAPRALAEAAAKRGLWVIYQMPAAPAGLEQALRIGGENGAYTTLWSNWATGAATELRDTPNLLGWMLPDDPRGLPIFDNNGFTRWLGNNYADATVLNSQWMPTEKFTSLNNVTLDGAGEMAAKLHESLDDDTQPQQSITGLPLLGVVSSASARGWAFHPAALAVALYKWDAYRSLLEFWAKTLREAAPGTTVFSGRLPDYAQMLSLPPSIDVSVPDVPPGVAEADGLTHNPQGTSIARRAGRFAAIPTFVSNGNAVMPTTNLPTYVAAWMDGALAHGASGIAFASWPDLQRNVRLRATITASIVRLQTPPFAMLWDMAPLANAAIVLTPLAEGQSVQSNALNNLDAPVETESEAAVTAGRGLYGFGENLVSGEPNGLVFMLRWGTAFGAVDYMAPDDLPAAGTTLNRYNTLLLPQALSLSDEMADQLGKYALAGGVVVADLGLGAAQSAGRLSEPAGPLLTLFGLSSPLQLRQDRTNFQMLQPHPLLPNWAGQQGGTKLTAAVTGGPAFRGPVAGGSPRPGTALLAATGGALTGDDPNVERAAYLTFKPLGAGGAIFAPVRLWQNWLPGAPGFDGFHGDLFSRGALLVQNGASAFVPMPAPALPGAPPNAIPYPETVDWPRAIAMLNHETPISPDSGLDPITQAAMATRDWSQVQTAAPGEWIWSGAITAISPVGTAPAPGMARIAPVQGVEGSEDRPQMVALHAFTPPGAMLVTQLVPIRLRHLTGGPLMARLMQWQDKKAVFALWPNATAFVPQGESFQITPGPSAGVHALIFNTPDGYRIQPGSRHKVTITTLALPPTPEPPPVPPVPPKGRPKKQPPPPPEPVIPPPMTKEVTADAQGRLLIEATGAALMIEVVPEGG